MEKDLDIQQIEFSNTNLSFIKNCAALEEYIDEVKLIFDFLKEEIDLLKENNGPLIGNPMWAMLNEAIKLEYEMSAHLLNCRNYQTHILSHDISAKTAFSHEIKILHQTTLDLTAAYKEFVSRVTHLRRMTFSRKRKADRINNAKRVS